MDLHDDGFGPYQKGEDEIAETYATPDGFEAALRALAREGARR